MTTTTLQPAATAPRTLRDLPWQATATSHLRPGDVFTTDAGPGVLIFVSQRPEALGTRCIDRDPLIALDLTGRRHEVYAGIRVQRLLDLDLLPECPVCDVGCDCARGTVGCGHFACWGRTTDATCSGAVGARIALYVRCARRRSVTA